jgi:hypothetical protein
VWRAIIVRSRVSSNVVSGGDDIGGFLLLRAVRLNIECKTRDARKRRRFARRLRELPIFR